MQHSIRRFSSAHLLLLSSVLLAACGGGGGGGGGGTAPDTTAPIVVSTAPTTAQGMVPLAASIAVTFSEPVDPATLTTTSFFVMMDFARLPGTLTVNGDTVVFEPDEPLRGEKSFEAVVTTAVTDLAGNALAANHSWRFATPFAGDVFVAHVDDGTIARLRPEPVSGALRHASYRPGGFQLAALALSPDGGTLYAAEAANDRVLALGIGADGSLASLGLAPTSGDAPSALAVTPDGRFVFSADLDADRVTSFPVDTSSGGLERAVGSYVVGASPTALAVEPGGRFLYVANGQDDSVSQLAIESDGSLASIAPPLDVGLRPIALAVHPRGRILFVANRQSQNVHALEIDPVTGELAGLPLGGSTMLGEVLGLAMHPGGHRLYATFASGEVAALSVDAITGALTEVGTRVAAGDGPRHAIVDAAGKYLHVTDFVTNQIHTFALDPSSGALEHTGQVLARVGPGAIVARSSAIDTDVPASHLYSLSHESGDLKSYAIEPASGAADEEGGPVGVGNGPVGLAVDPLGRFVLATAQHDDSVALYRIDATTLLPELASADVVAVGEDPIGLVVEPSGRFAYVACTSSDSVGVLAIDAVAGTLTVLDYVPVISDPGKLVLDPSGRFLYVVASDLFLPTIAAFAIDVETGLLTPNAGVMLGGFPRDIAVDPAGGFLYLLVYGSATTIGALSIDPSTGRLDQSLPPVAAGTNALHVAPDPSGRRVYVLDTASDEILLYSATGGVLTLEDTAPATGDAPRAMAIDPTGRFAWIANKDSDDLSPFRIEIATGALTWLGANVPAGDLPLALALVER